MQRVLTIDAGDVRGWGPRRGLGGIPGPTPQHPDFPDMTPLWRDAGITLVRSFDWLSRLDTRNSPQSLFPDWDADPTDPASYDFAATDHWVDSVHAIGADVLFTIASAIPSNKLPALDTQKYGVVVEHVVRHYAQGWADGPTTPVRRFEFGDQVDFGLLHFAGPPEAFYAMYEAFCAAVARVDDTLWIGGPSLAFPLNPDAPFREGFLDFVRERGLPLHFFSFLAFTDATRDPRDFDYTARQVRSVLDERGFGATELVLSYWNYLAIPSNHAPSAEKAAFFAAASIHLLDTPLDHALFFRADSGQDPHYGFRDPAGLHDADGAPDERATAFALTGRAMTGERLAVSGGDGAGFVATASRDGDRVRVLVANFVAPPSALEPRDSEEFRFRIPIGAERIELSFRVPPQRDGLASAGVDSALLELTDLPWPGRTVSITERSLDGSPQAPRRAAVGASGELAVTVDLAPQSVVLVEIEPEQAV